MKYDESTLQSWTKPLSDTEEQRAKDTINMIRSAIDACDELRQMDIEVFLQGSYANNTNVKTDSDVDVCVMVKDSFHIELPDGMEMNDYGFSESDFSFDYYRKLIKQALKTKFQADYVKDGNKSLKIDENTYHVKADVVPALMLKNYYYNHSKDPCSYIEGTWIIPKTGKCIANYPKKHIQNGRTKNNQTNGFYKKLVRIMKHIKNNMVDDKIVDNDIISSFLIECLVWNIPNDIIMQYDSWEETIRESIVFLYDSIDNGKHNYWGEVSEILYLFQGRKWKEQDVKQMLLDAWKYLDFDK